MKLLSFIYISTLLFTLSVFIIAALLAFLFIFSILRKEKKRSDLESSRESFEKYRKSIRDAEDERLKEDKKIYEQKKGR